MAAASPAGHNSSRIVGGNSASIHLIENHDEAYYVWREAGIRDRPLVHIDAHHDMWPIEQGQPVTIADFVFAAMRERLVSDIYWIVPDRSFERRGARRALMRMVRSLASVLRAPRPIESGPDRIEVSLRDSRLTITTLDALRLGGGPVLLDIDVDYLMIPQVSVDRADTHSELPWRWPKELLAGIDAVRISPEIITISYSIDGCYTPLAWKYLGVEIADRIAGSSDCRGYDLLREGAKAAASGDFDSARRAYLAAASSLSESAAPQFHLALLSQRFGRLEQARRHYRRAIEIDPSYSTGFNTLGWQYLWEWRHRPARREFTRALELDPAHVYAMLGMAQLALRRRDWRLAEQLASRALECAEDNLDAHRCLAQACERNGRLDRAIAHYERSLLLAMRGGKPLSWNIRTPGCAGKLVDEDHCSTYAELGRLRARRGDLDGAIACYRIALSARHQRVRDHLRLARLYAAKGRAPEAMVHARRAVMRLPGSISSHARRIRTVAIRRIAAIPDLWRTPR